VHAWERLSGKAGKQDFFVSGQLLWPRLMQDVAQLICESFGRVRMAPDPIAILIPFVVGLAATVATVAIHGAVFHAIVMTLRRDLKRGLLGARTWVNSTFIFGTILVALGSHLAEIVLWGFVLHLSGAVTSVGAAVYSSAGSYTTSGSDILLPPQWRLLGPFEAVDGMLMFGVSTAFIFAVVSRLIHARYDDADTFVL
jgi:hypothetical protein